jgi:hypothetical protein
MSHQVLYDITQDNTFTFGVAYYTMTTPPYPVDFISIFLDILLPIIFLMCYLLVAVLFTYLMAEEKEHKHKAAMKMIGLKESTYILSWFIIYLIITVTMSLISILILSSNVLKESNLGFVFLFLILYGISQFGVVLLAV